MGKKATGTLIWRKSGWCAQWFRTDEAGERVREWKPLGTSNEALARRELARLVAAAETQESAEAVDTVTSAAKRYVALRKRTVTSWRNDEAVLRNHVVPAIGAMPVVDVQRRDAIAVFESLRDAGMAAGSILHVRNTLHGLFKMLAREGVVERSPVPSADELPEALPESIEDRPKAVLSDDELCVHMHYTDPRTGERYRGGVRERQMIALFARCLGGARTGELHSLTWGRVGAETGAFDAVELIRNKTKKKAARTGSKAVGRQIFPLGDTVLPEFLRFWYVRGTLLMREPPALDAPVFPVRGTGRSLDAERRMSPSGTLRRRAHATWASALRRDLKHSFAEAAMMGNPTAPKLGSKRWKELFDGTEDRQPLTFHNQRNAAAVAAERFQRLQSAATFTGHASGRMLQHYREKVGEVDVALVVPELLPDASELRRALLSWCEAENIDPALVFTRGAPDLGTPGPLPSPRAGTPNPVLVEQQPTATHPKAPYFNSRPRALRRLQKGSVGAKKPSDSALPQGHVERSQGLHRLQLPQHADVVVADAAHAHGRGRGVVDLDDVIDGVGQRAVEVEDSGLGCRARERSRCHVGFLRSERE